LTICSKECAEEILTSPKAKLLTHVVSIGEPGSEPPLGFQSDESDFEGHKLRLEFDDITAAGGWSAVMAGYQCPRPSDALALITFFKRNVLVRPSPRVLIHCAQGISRSAAGGLTLLFMNYGEADRAARELWALNPEGDTFHPNPLFIALLDEALQAGTELIRAAGIYRLMTDNEESVIEARRDEYGG
jgi:predicted protein tyrosine phosphatase